MNTRRLTLRLMALMAIVSFGATSCYPELYEEKDTYLEDIKTSQQGIGHGGEEHGEEHGDATHSEAHGSNDTHGEGTDKAHGEEHGEAHSSDTHGEGH